MTAASPATPRETRRWVVLAVVYICSLAFAATLQSLPPILPAIIKDLGASHAEAGLLMSFFALPGIILLIPVGILADRYGNRPIAIAAFSAMIAGQAIFATGGSIAVLSVGRLLAGAGTMSLGIILPQLLARWFHGREMGTAMGIFNTGMPLGTILSLNFLSLISETTGWRGAVWAAAAVPLVAALVFFLLLPRSPAPAQPQPTGGNPFRNLGSLGKPVWLVGTAWLLFNAAMITLFTFTPDFLRSTGASAATAGLVASASMWPALVMSPVVGWLIDRFGRTRSMVGFASIGLAVFIFLVPLAPDLALPLMLIIGLLQTFIPASVMALVPRVVKMEQLGLGFGVVSTCLNIGIIIGPAAAGMARDATGSYTASYALMALFAILISLVMLVLRLVRDSRTLTP